MERINVQIDVSETMTNTEKERLLNLGEETVISVVFGFNPILLIIGILSQIFTIYFFLRLHFSAWYVCLLFLVIALILCLCNIKENEKVTGLCKSYLSERITDFRISYENVTPEGILGLFFIIGFILIYWILYRSSGNHAWYMHFLFFIASIFGGIMYIGLNLIAERKRKFVKSYTIKRRNYSGSIDDFKIAETDLTENYIDLFKDFFLNKKLENVDLDFIDQRSTEIARRESTLKMINTKVDAYLLESVFLGGLAFSGFLTVLSGNDLVKVAGPIKTFCNNCVSFSKKLLYINREVDPATLLHTFSRADLFIVIMFLCLICSVLFLLVLMLRMKYMKLYLNMDHLLRILLIFGAKEEELMNDKYENADLSEKQRKRLESINQKMNFALSDSENVFKELNPIITIMSLCRNSAVFVFYVILAISGCYFNLYLFYFIILIAFSFIALRFITSLSINKKVKKLLSRH